MGLLCFALGACAPTARERMEAEWDRARPAPAAASAAAFFLDENSPPEREVDRKRFYFKDCELVARRAFPSRSEYDCAEK